MNFKEETLKLTLKPTAQNQLLALILTLLVQEKEVLKGVIVSRDKKDLQENVENIKVSHN